MNVLIIAAHPDDEILGMGGTISKHTSQNDDVTIIYMATGITARRELLDDKHEIKNIPKIEIILNEYIFDYGGKMLSRHKYFYI